MEEKVKMSSLAMKMAIEVRIYVCLHENNVCKVSQVNRQKTKSDDKCPEAKTIMWSDMQVVGKAKMEMQEMSRDVDRRQLDESRLERL